MVNCLIELFVHSTEPVPSALSYTHSSYFYLHGHVSSETMERTIDIGSKFKGRVFPQEEYRALEQLTEIAEKTGEEIKIYDVSRIADRLKALKRGIGKTPTAIIRGKKYEGLDEIQKATLKK